MTAAVERRRCRFCGAGFDANTSPSPPPFRQKIYCSSTCCQRAAYQRKKKKPQVYEPRHGQPEGPYR